MCVQPMIQSPVRVRQKAVRRTQRGKDAKMPCKRVSSTFLTFLFFASLRESPLHNARWLKHFITGAQGCIGSWIVKALTNRATRQWSLTERRHAPFECDHSAGDLEQ